MILTQTAYVEKLLKKYNMENAIHKFTPMETTFKIKNNENNESINQTTYRGAIGALSFSANNTRPDIAFSVNVLSQFQENPTKNEWNAIERILQYLKLTKKFGIIFLFLSITFQSSLSPNIV